MQGFIILLMLQGCGGLFPSSTMEYGLLIGLSPTRWQPTPAIYLALGLLPGMRSSSDVINDDG